MLAAMFRAKFVHVGRRWGCCCACCCTCCWSPGARALPAPTRPGGHHKCTLIWLALCAHVPPAPHACATPSRRTGSRPAAATATRTESERPLRQRSRTSARRAPSMRAPAGVPPSPRRAPQVGDAIASSPCPSFPDSPHFYCKRTPVERTVPAQARKEHRTQQRARPLILTNHSVQTCKASDGC